MTGIAFAKRAMLKALRKRAIATVEIMYDGKDGFACTQAILAFDTEAQPVDVGLGIDTAVELGLYRGTKPARYCALGEALDDFAWLLLDHFHEGFERGEGGYGSITIDAAKGTVTLDHDDRMVQSINIRTEA